MENFKSLRDAKEFERSALPYLLAATESLFGCKATYHARPIENLSRKGIDVELNPRRGVYIVDDSTVYVLGRVLEGKELIAAFSLKLTHGRFGHLKRFLNIYEAALALTLSRSYKFRFRDPPQQFGDGLVRFAIAKSFSKGNYDHRKFLLLLEVFRKLSSTTFERRNFTTGMILTRSMYAYAEKREHSRFGKVYELSEPVDLTPAAGINRRYWYLADGQTSFFMVGRDMLVRNLFLLSPENNQVSSFTDDYTLSKTIRGADALFRVGGQAEFSVMDSDRLEFAFKDNHWTLRSFEELSALILKHLSVSEEWLQRFLFFVFMMSRRRASSLIWVPLDQGQISEVAISMNQLTVESLSILEPNHAQTIYRLFSSDGATIISQDGEILHFGAVIDIAKANVEGVRGTGESVAGVLASNGIAVKVSQDGGIKVFADTNEAPLVF